MRILVTVASRHGSTGEIAEAIADELRGTGHEVDCLPTGEVQHVKGYDAVILGSAIYFGHWLPDAHIFIDRFAESLTTVPVWLFSSGPLRQEDAKDEQMAEILGAIHQVHHLRNHHVFVGKLDPRSLSLPERLVTKVIGAPVGDFRDWNEIRAWAQSIASQVRPAA